MRGRYWKDLPRGYEVAAFFWGFGFGVLVTIVTAAIIKVWGIGG